MNINDDKILELVYLFVDGEATDTEREILFSALASNSAVQKELQSAIVMSNSTRADSSRTELPKAVAAGFFTKAGFSAETQPVAASGAQKFAMPFLNRFLVPLLSAFIGFVGAWYLLPDKQAEQKEIIPPVTGYASESPKAVDHDTVIIEKKPADNAQRTHLRKPLPATNNYQNRDEADEQARKPVYAAILTSQIKNSGTAFPEDKPGTRPVPSSALAPELFPDGLYGTGSNNSIFEHFSLQAWGFSTIMLFPDRDPDKTKIPTLNNLSLELCYDLGSGLSIGLAGGQETFPIYISNSEGKLEYNTSIKWLCMTFGYNGESVFVDELNPFVKLLGGSTVSGPVVKALAGISWQPDSNTRLMLGVEGTFLRYYYIDRWDWSEKLGIKYGIELKF